MRKTAYAGQFYPQSVSALNKMLEECFTAKLGPRALPSKPKQDVPPYKAAICPHAGYVYSGMAAAWSYKAMAEVQVPDVFILLGPNHHSMESGISLETFETPLGNVRVDQEFGKALAKKGSVRINEEIHRQEHSLEVQLPFLLFAFSNRTEKIKILPFIVAEDLDMDKAAEDLKATISELKRKVTFIVSSDFTHYGRNYGYVPFSTDIKDRIYKLDGEAINLIKAGDAKGFSEYVYKTGATICGQFGITLLLKTISFKSALLEQYYISGDIINDYANSVSYASIIFK